MPDETEEYGGDDARIGRMLRERLPRHTASARLRSAIVQAVSDESARHGWWRRWPAPAASALATAMIMLLWLAPSLSSTRTGDPIRLLANALLSEHARTILWGESRDDVVPAVLPRAMEESGVALNWVFSGDQEIQLVNAQATYLEGRPGIELAYRDTDGHTVSYVVLPAGTLPLPERGRVQIERWRPLVHKEGGFSFIIWKQQELICALVADLVSEADLVKFKHYFVKIRSSTDPYAVY